MQATSFDKDQRVCDLNSYTLCLNDDSHLYKMTRTKINVLLRHKYHEYVLLFIITVHDFLLLTLICKPTVQDARYITFSTRKGIYEDMMRYKKKSNSICTSSESIKVYREKQKSIFLYLILVGVQFPRNARKSEHFNCFLR